MKSNKARALALGLSGCALLAGCGSDRYPTHIPVKVIDLSSANNASGRVTLCAGKDTTREHKEFIRRFNETNRGRFKARLLEFPESADEQRNQFVQRQRAKSSGCDVFSSDVVWTAEFAQQGWLYDLTPYVQQREDEFISSTLATGRYGRRYFGVPKQTDAGFLYYRKDLIARPPSSWQEVYSLARKTNGLVYQGHPYEGLTVDFLEIAFAAGGHVLSNDGKKADFNSSENLRALNFMISGIKTGAVKKAVTTYKEEEARRSFEAGRSTFMRNWPYAYSLGKRTKLADKYAVVPYPPFQGGGRAGILGGHNLVISAYSKNPGAALTLVDSLTQPEQLKRTAVKHAVASVLKATYDDPDVKQAIPFSAELREAIEQAKSRPVTPVYPQISRAIARNINAALSGQIKAETALRKANQQIDAALHTF